MRNPMLPKKEISKDPRLNDIVLELQEGIPALDGYTGEDGSGIKVILQDFLFSAPYRVGEQVYLARTDSLGLAFFPEDVLKYGEINLMDINPAKYFTIDYLKYRCFVPNRFADPHSRIEFLEITPAIYDTPQPSLDGGLPLNAFEVKGRLTRSKLEQKL